MTHGISFYFISGLKVLTVIPLIIASYLMPRSRKRIVFGAWFSNLYADNPKYLMLYVLEHTDMKVTWVGQPAVEAQLPKHPNLEFARKDSAKAIWALLRARTWVICTSLHADLTDLPLRGTALCINVWHGIPLKYVGRRAPFMQDIGKDSFLGRMYTSLMHAGPKWGYLTTSSEHMSNMLCDGVPDLMRLDKLLRVGTPRNDFLIHNANNQTLRSSLKQKYAKVLGFDPSKKIVLYLPTHRQEGNHVFAFYDLSDADQERVKEVLDKNEAVLIEKHHYWTLKNFPQTKPSICSISISAEKQYEIDVQELLLITDVFLCDYTSAYLDFALLKRPVVHFAYDYDHYKTKDSGMAYGLEEYAAGEVVFNLNSMLSLVDRQLSRPAFNPCKKMNDLVVYETGMSCAEIVRFINQ